MGVEEKLRKEMLEIFYSRNMPLGLNAVDCPRPDGRPGAGTECRAAPDSGWWPDWSPAAPRSPFCHPACCCHDLWYCLCSTACCPVGAALRRRRLFILAMFSGALFSLCAALSVAQHWFTGFTLAALGIGGVNAVVQQFR